MTKQEVINHLKEIQQYYCDALAIHAEMVKYPSSKMDELAQKLFDGQLRVTEQLAKLL